MYAEQIKNLNLNTNKSSVKKYLLFLDCSLSTSFHMKFSSPPGGEEIFSLLKFCSQPKKVLLSSVSSLPSVFVQLTAGFVQNTAAHTAGLVYNKQLFLSNNRTFVVIKTILFSKQYLTNKKMYQFQKKIKNSPQS